MGLLDTEHSWYADFTKKEQYTDVTKFGVSLGIPDYQLDFSPHIKEWESNHC